MEQAQKYAYKIYEKKSFSVAAKELYLSQPALSARIARLEKDLGFKIFDRGTNPISLTPRGRIYIEYLEDIIESENNMRSRMKHLGDLTGGTISIGALCHTAYCIFPQVCAKFQKKYPNITINLYTGNIRTYGNTLDATKKYMLDIVTTYRSVYDGFITSPIISERLVIAMNRNSPEARELMPFAISRKELLEKSYSEEKKIYDFSVLKKIKLFGFTNVGSTVNKLMERFEGQVDYVRCNINNAEHLTMHYNMLRAGVGAIVASDVHASQSVFDCDDIVYLLPECNEAYRTLYLAIKQGTDENIAIRSFVEMAQEIYSGKDIKS